MQRLHSPTLQQQPASGIVGPGRIGILRKKPTTQNTTSLDDDHPALVGVFDSRRFDPSFAGRVFVACGDLQCGDAYGIHCRLQAGPDALYWFANAADPSVWQLIDRWTATGKLALGAQFLDGRVVDAVVPFQLAAHVAAFKDIALRNQARATAAFRSLVGEIVATGNYGCLDDLKAPGLPEVQRVQGVIVETEHTAGIRWPLPPAHLPCDGQLLIPTPDGRDIAFYRGAALH
ncbi:hypothetical protein [Variovorax sp. Sphag1AA]|uniref:hypothetical protein n=1 Tax=Variovorax sp. Sphag1AA TaxID=2587027 RepID=UPI00160AA6F3|nr:hypothetical protein [Variovorax sp. Sphag1AA]MBB3180955.1 hypothetical protein [Variovorax sp. Sphag1AA]